MDNLRFCLGCSGLNVRNSSHDISGLVPSVSNRAHGMSIIISTNNELFEDRLELFPVLIVGNDSHSVFHSGTSPGEGGAVSPKSTAPREIFQLH